MRRILAEIAVILGATLAAGTVYTLAAGKLAFFTHYNVVGCSRGRPSDSAPAALPTPASGATLPAASSSAAPSREAPPREAPPVLSQGPPAVAVASPAVPASGGAEANRLPEIGLDATYQHWLDESLFVDARRTKYYLEGHIPGSICISPFEPERDERVNKAAEEEPREAPVVVYCSGSADCVDSHDIGFDLKSAGFTAVFVYKGGFPEWAAAGKPVVKGEEIGQRGGAQ